MTRSGFVILMCAGCGALSFAVDLDGPLPVNAGLQRLDRPETAPEPTIPAFPTGAVWTSEYDRSLDGTLTIEETTAIAVSGANDRLIGNYAEHRAVGKPNDSVFTGRFIPGTPPVVTLRQDDEPGYTAVYTGRLVAPNQFIGTYFDNRGFSGDWSLTLDSRSDAATPIETIESIERSID